MSKRAINLTDYLQDVLRQLQEAELRCAGLRGQRDLLIRMMQPPMRTDGEEQKDEAHDAADHPRTP